MKKYLMTLAAILCCVVMTTALTSCSSDDDEENVQYYDVSVANKDYDVTMAFNGLHSVITKVKNAPTWLTVTPQTALNSDGAPVAIFKVKATDDGAERKCTLYLSTSSNEQAVLTVTQTQSDSDDENYPRPPRQS